MSSRRSNHCSHGVFKTWISGRTFIKILTPSSTRVYTGNSIFPNWMIKNAKLVLNTLKNSIESLKHEISKYSTINILYFQCFHGQDSNQSRNLAFILWMTIIWCNQIKILWTSRTWQFQPPNLVLYWEMCLYRLWYSIMKTAHKTQS